LNPDSTVGSSEKQLLIAALLNTLQHLNHIDHQQKNAQYEAGQQNLTSFSIALKEYEN
jgi:hypothetical protein